MGPDASRTSPLGVASSGPSSGTLVKKSPEMPGSTCEEHMFRSTEVVAIASVLVGCAHSGPRFELRQALEKEAAVVYLYRQSKFFGAAVYPDVFIDGVARGTIDSGGYARFELPAGRHMLKVETRMDLNHGAAWLEL